MGWKKLLRPFFSGILGGAADVVPGISGGTVYYLIGIYDELLKSISDLPRDFMSALRTKSPRVFLNAPSIQFLMCVGTGVALAFCSLASAIVFLMNSEVWRPLVMSLFFGLVIGSVCITAMPVAQSLLRSPSWRQKCYICALFFIGVCAGVCFDLSLSMKEDPSRRRYSIELPQHVIAEYRLVQDAKNYNQKTGVLFSLTAQEISVLVTKGTLSSSASVWDSYENKYCTASSLLSQDVALRHLHISYIAAGALASVAMLLPGISGSYMLHVLGMYGPILSHFLTFMDMLIRTGSIDFFSLFVLLQVALGIGCGALLFSQVLYRGIQRYPLEIHAAMSGCLLGSVWILWPFQHLVRKLNPYTLERGYEVEAVGRDYPGISKMLSQNGIEIAIIVGAMLFLFLLNERRKKKERVLQRAESFNA